MESGEWIDRTENDTPHELNLFRGAFTYPVSLPRQSRIPRGRSRLAKEVIQLDSNIFTGEASSSTSVVS